ncbi:hypothetical protein PIB30_087718, partial [Stylosanthes scabra]|nr:hypothetical protein [Stylosanthes scabra]
MYALALKGKTSPKLLTSFSSSLTPQSFNPRGIDTHFTVVLFDTIRYTCRDLGVKAQRALQFEQGEANSDEGASEEFSEEEIVEENSEEEIQDNMADNANNQRKALADYTNPTTASCGSSIVWPTVDANNFELKPAGPTSSAKPTFYDGTLPTSRILLDSAANGSLRTKTPEEALELIELVATNQYMNFSERSTMKKGVLEVDSVNVLMAQLSAMNKKLETLEVSTVGTQ